MRQFLDWAYIGTAGYVGFSVPGFTIGLSPTAINTFLQTDPILRIKSTNVATRWADVVIDASAGWYDQTDPLQVGLHVYLEAAGTVYVPLREVLASALQRRTSGLSLLSPTPPMVACSVRVALLDSALDLLDSSEFTLAVFDSIGDQSSGDWRGLAVPDTWRVSGGAANYFCVPMGHYSSHATEFAAFRAAGDYDALSMVDDGTTVCFAMTSANPYIMLQVRDTGGVLASTRVVWEPCMSDKLKFRWWSPQSGGWKSQVADVVGGSDEVTERAAQLRGFSMVDGVSAELGFSCRFPSLTFRDWLYFRDILYSDEVYVDLETNTALGGTFQSEARAVRVNGGGAAWKLNEVRDFTFTVKTDTLREL